MVMACCRCKRTGTCLRCARACVRAGRPCENCLPEKLGNCTNRCLTPPHKSPSQRPPPTTENANATPATSPTIMASADDTTSPAIPYPELPAFIQVGRPTFTWGNCSGEEFVSILNATHAEVVNWRPNTFSAPVGRMGRNFVTELSRLYLAFEGLLKP